MSTTSTTFQANDTVRIEGKRTFSRCTFGTSDDLRQRYGDNADGRMTDYCWLNADAMVIDGRAKPEVPTVQYGATIEIDGYGLFTIERPPHGDHPVLEPACRELTYEQDRAVDALGEAADLLVRRTPCRVPGQPIRGREVVLRVSGLWRDHQDRPQHRVYHVFPDGSTHELVRVGEMGRLDYKKPIA